MSTLHTKASAVLEQLRELSDAPATAPANADTARQWEEAVRATVRLLEDRAHPIVFIGSVGVGKSSLVGVLANLLVGPRPSDRPSLKESSVLAIGSGRTTLCEVRIRPPREGDAGSVGLLIEPLPDADMKREIELYAQDEWSRRLQGARRTGEDDADPTAQEIQRAIRGMTGYVEYQETFLEGNLKRRRNVRPLEQEMPRFKDARELGEHLVEKANLPARQKKAWWRSSADEGSLRELKSFFESVNEGLDPEVPLPQRMTLIVPDPLPGKAGAWDLTLIDTRGLDGKVEARRDLRDLLRDPRAVIVLCAPFKEAPGDAQRALLRTMATDAELRQAISRTLLVLLDQGDAEQVNGAKGDREYGQELKLDECHLALESAGAPIRLDRSQLVAFDALQDDRVSLVETIEARLILLREVWISTLAEQVADAQSFLDSRDDEVRRARRDSVDRKIRETMAQHPLSGAPMNNPLEGLIQEIRDCRYASVVYATCRRNGSYPSLDLYAAVYKGAVWAAMSWLEELISAVRSRLVYLLADTSLATVHEHVRLRRSQFEQGQLKVLDSYATKVWEQVERLLKPDSVWSACCEEWGKGGGFKERVIEQLEAWARRQPGLTAHERTDAVRAIPLLGEVARPVAAPRFTVAVRNLRALRRSSWTPAPVSLLIGANGAGKTTLLQTLKFLRVAYRSGLPEAVKEVFKGSHNLRSWGALPEEPVEIGLDLGGASWRIELILREGSVDYLTNERFLDGGRLVFSRDTLGTFIYGEERLDPSPLTGLRVLIDRGVHEPALRRMEAFLQGIAVYTDPDLPALREGSRTTDDRVLFQRGTNTLTLLRRWSQDREHRHRYQFVVEGMNAAFPGLVSEIGFVEAGTTLAARVYRPGSEQPSPLESEANGVLQMLVLLSEVAAAEDGSLVAIDEPENGLHPYALRRFLDRTSRWARQHNLTVLLATHSIMLLDELSAHPEQVYVMKAPAAGEPSPARLDQLYDREWLQRFRLGNLYERGEIGSNEDEA